MSGQEINEGGVHQEKPSKLTGGPVEHSEDNSKIKRGENPMWLGPQNEASRI